MTFWETDRTERFRWSRSAGGLVYLVPKEIALRKNWLANKVLIDRRRLPVDESIRELPRCMRVRKVTDWSSWSPIAMATTIPRYHDVEV
jgi:hypothetical protein